MKYNSVQEALDARLNPIEMALDAWSPEARAAAAEARKRGSSGSEPKEKSKRIPRISKAEWERGEGRELWEKGLARPPKELSEGRSSRSTERPSAHHPSARSENWKKKSGDAGFKDFLKGKLSEDDYKTACDMMEDD